MTCMCTEAHQSIQWCIDRPTDMSTFFSPWVLFNLQLLNSEKQVLWRWIKKKITKIKLRNNFLLSIPAYLISASNLVEIGVKMWGAKRVIQISDWIGKYLLIHVDLMAFVLSMEVVCSKILLYLSTCCQWKFCD